MDGPQSGSEMVLQLQEEKRFDFFKEIRSLTCGLVGFPIPQGPEGIGRSEQVEEIGRARPRRTQNNDRVFDRGEGGAGKSF